MAQTLKTGNIADVYKKLIFTTDTSNFQLKFTDPSSDNDTIIDTISTAMTLAGQLTLNAGVKTDTISEKTGLTGVTIDSVLLKDGSVKLGTSPGYIKSADGGNVLTISDNGDVSIEGTLTLTGNSIKASDGNEAISLASTTVSFPGIAKTDYLDGYNNHMEIRSKKSMLFKINTSDSGTYNYEWNDKDGTDLMTLSNTGNLVVTGDLTVTGGNITNAIEFDSAVTIDANLTIDGDLTFTGASRILTFDSSSAELTLKSGGANYVVLDGSAGKVRSIKALKVEGGLVEAPVALASGTSSPGITNTNLTYMLDLSGGNNITVNLPTPTEAGWSYKYKVVKTGSAWVKIDTQSNGRYFVGGIKHVDTDASDDGVATILSNNTANYIFTMTNPLVGTELEVVYNGTFWYITGEVHTVAASTDPAFTGS